MKKHLFASEAVTEGHPDKVCDQIADAVLDEVMRQDPMGRVACEVCVNGNAVLVMGEISTTAQIDVEQIVRQTASYGHFGRAELALPWEWVDRTKELSEMVPD